MTELPKLTLKCLLKNSAENFADRPAVSMVEGEPVTYADFNRQVQELIQFLGSRGIRKGDNVAILSENKPQWGMAYFAVATMGAIVVPILPDFHENEVHHIIRHARCKAIFVSEKLFEKIEEIEPAPQTIILIDNFQIIPSQAKGEKIKEIVNKGSWEISRLKQAALKAAGVQAVDIEENDLAAIIYTSGTTGHSKGVMLTHKNLVSNALGGISIQPINERDRFLSILPLSHTFECTVGFIIPILQGACIYYFSKPPTPRLLLKALAEIKPTIMLSVPLVIEKIYKTRIIPQLTHNKLLRKLHQIHFFRKQLHKLAGKKLMKSFGGQIRFFGIGGALLAPDVERFLRDAGFPYAIGYGLTETSPLAAGATFRTLKYRSTGPAISGVEIKIDHPDPKTGEGEIFVKGPNVMKGYFNDPERTAEVLTEDGWFKTGDLGIIDKDGFLFIKGRSKNMILGPSGENIYPEEIEGILNEFDSVLESLVFEQEGKVCARVHLNYEELDKEFSAQKLNNFQVKKRIEELLEQLRKDVNIQLSPYSRIAKIIEQTEPFIKTPTQKTKRFLYVNQKIDQ